MSRFSSHLILLLVLASLFVAGPVFGQGERVVEAREVRRSGHPCARLAHRARRLAKQRHNGAAAVVIELDTPGGSVDITQDLTQRMTAARVPVIVWVAPSGAHAGSAGTFITLAGTPQRNGAGQQYRRGEPGRERGTRPRRDAQGQGDKHPRRGHQKPGGAQGRKGDAVGRAGRVRGGSGNRAGGACRSAWSMRSRRTWTACCDSWTAGP